MLQVSLTDVWQLHTSLFLACEGLMSCAPSWPVSSFSSWTKKFRLVRLSRQLPRCGFCSEEPPTGISQGFNLFPLVLFMQMQ